MTDTNNKGTGEVSGIEQSASGSGVPSDLIMNVVMDAFDYIDFSTLMVGLYYFQCTFIGSLMANLRRAMFLWH